ncbi:hypothetical protein PAXRUDRAFT_156320 [Paxillus rubicundulus Ve08.2h10]|uniref:HAT C-terminal dimerisation domain-containing protein n=1 Tax=Paxillus rubicundulus Ve08.2h10 TaxID=930991 RepID=A0A0D0D069_9AGAM|nr:hypothetical protein PAXRUDRAFT_156320 [Paxillus rubicundulus Ve08.2h10]
MDVPQQASGQQTVEQELASYLATDIAQKTDPLAFWHVSHATFSTLFQIAMDYLPIQASSVPCKQVFSSSAETMTKQHNHISPILMEALQMTKFFLKKDWPNFMKGWITSQKDMQQDIEEGDQLAVLIEANLSKDQVMEAIDDVMVAIADGKGNEISDNVILFLSMSLQCCTTPVALISLSTTLVTC